MINDASPARVGDASPAEALLQALDLSDTGVWTWEIATDAVTWTRACYRLVGAEPDGEPLTLASFMGRIHPDDLDDVQQQVQAAIASRSAFECEFRIVQREGRVRWLVNHGRAVYDAQGQPVRMLGSVRDITEQKHLALNLRESQERLQLAVEAAGIGIWTWDLDSDRVTWSAECYRIQGMRAGQFGGNGKAFFDTVHPEDRERVRRAARTAIQRNELLSVEFRIQRPDGDVVWVADRARVRYDGKGQPVAMLGTITDITDLKQKELALQAALTASNTGTFRWDIRKDSLDWDDELDRLFGLEPASSVRSLPGFIALVHDNDRQAVIAACERCRSTGADFEMEFRVVWPDGSIHWLYDRGQTFRDADGRPAWMTGACVDITQRRRMEEELRRSEAFYRQVLESIHGMTFTATADGRFDYMSEQWHAFTGIALADLLAGSVPIPYHPDDQPVRDASRARALASGMATDVECRIRSAAGRYEWFKIRTNLVSDDAGRPVRWIGTAVNVHDLKAAQETLALSRSRLDYATRLSGVGFWYCDLPFDELQWDDRVKEHFFFPPQARITIDDFYARIHEEDREATRLAIAGSIASRAPYDIVYRTVDPATKQVKWIRALGGTDYGSDGTPAYFDGVTVDVTAQKLDQQELALLNERLREQDRRKDEFIATLSHELRNPLSPIRAAAKVLASPQLSPEQLRRAQTIIDRQASHMALLLDDLLDVARITQGKLHLKKQAVALPDMVDAAVEAARPTLDAKDHRLSIELPPFPVLLEADPLRLSQILSNLLINAAKYSGPGSRIEVCAAAVDETLQLSVKDQGIGIAADALNGIFDIFTQVQGSAGMADGGIGIGLALVKGLAQLHGGSVEARSAGLGLGSEFIVRLPLVQAANTSRTVDRAPAAAIPQLRRKILVADDNQDAAETLALLLELAGHEVQVANLGRMALSRAQDFRPDIAVLDIGMPDISGYDVAESLRKESWGKGIQLIALTGWGRDSDRVDALRRGFDHHLSKPVDSNQLISLIAAHNEGRL